LGRNLSRYGWASGAADSTNCIFLIILSFLYDPKIASTYCILKTGEIQRYYCFSFNSKHCNWVVSKSIERFGAANWYKVSLCACSRSDGDFTRKIMNEYILLFFTECYLKMAIPLGVSFAAD
jgi:hypothetical protein